MKTVPQHTLHPWHGIPAGNDAPNAVTAFIEIVPTDTIKYEIDKHSGWLKVDRPQQYSNTVPALYGFVPQTYCHTQVAQYCMQQTGRSGIVGDGDPLDILVLSEKPFPTGGFLVQATPIGGFRMIDKNEADDKIIAVMKGDALYTDYTDISQLNAHILQRLKHYFLTYKDMPGQTNGAARVEIAAVYGPAEAHEVIKRSMADYAASFKHEE